MASNRSDSINWTKVLWISAIMVLIAILAMPTLVVVIIGMLPTGVAAIIDRSEQKFGTFCVGGLNLCGVFPYLIKLWTDNLQMAGATGMISDVFTLFVMYSAAAFGWMMFLALPPVISSFLTVMAESRVKTLRSLQRDIIEEWGPEVSSALDDDPASAGVAPPPG